MAMTDEQRFFFDLRGWILLPAVLSQQEIDAARAECYTAVERGEHLGAKGYDPRCAVFNCYNSVWAQWHRVGLDHEAVMRMPPKRRSLFRGVWQLGGNTAYSAENRAL